MKYNKQLTKHGYVTVSDYIDDKYDLIHKKLYNDALDRYITKQYAKSLALYGGNKTYNPDDYLYIEHPSDEYQKPSYIYVISKQFPFTRELVSLEKYWCNYQEDLQSGKIKNINDLMIDDESLNDAKITEVDYARGYVTLYSKTTDKTFTVDFDYITGKQHIDRESTLYNTFMYKLKNKIFKQ